MAQQRRGHYNRNDEWVDDEEDQAPPLPAPAPGIIQQPGPAVPVPGLPPFAMPDMVGGAGIPAAYPGMDQPNRPSIRNGPPMPQSYQDPLHFVQQASDQLRQNLTSVNSGIPLDQANMMAAQGMAGLYAGLPGNWLSHQQNMGRLNLDTNLGMGHHGPNGWVPGTAANAAQAGWAQHSPERLADQTRDRVRELLLTQGMADTEVTQTLNSLFLGSRPSGPGTDFQSGRPPMPTPTVQPGAANDPATNAVGNTIPGSLQERINRAILSSSTAFPLPQGVQSRPNYRRPTPQYAGNEAAFNQAITNYFSQFSGEHEINPANYNEIMQGASSYFQTDPIQAWYRQHIPTMERRRDAFQEAQLQHRNRLARVLGMSTSPSFLGVPLGEISRGTGEFSTNMGPLNPLRYGYTWMGSSRPSGSLPLTFPGR